MSDYYLKVCIGLHFLFKEYKLSQKLITALLGLYAGILVLGIIVVSVMFLRNTHSYITYDNITARQVFPLWSTPTILKLNKLTPAYEVKETNWSTGDTRTYTVYNVYDTTFTVFQADDAYAIQLQKINTLLKGK
jgi:hypothetical protein